jgi:flagellar hook-length control protein FliK
LSAVSETSVVRAPTHSQAGNRSQAGADQASSPFSELLDSCEAPEEPAAASTSKPVESARTEAVAADGAHTEAAPQEGKTDKPENPANTPEGKDAAEVSAELALVIAAAGQQPAPKGKEEKEGSPTLAVSPDEAVPDQTQPDADGPAQVPQADAADTPDAQVAVQPVSAPVATPVSSAIPAVAEAMAPVAAPTATEATVGTQPMATDSTGTLPPAVKGATAEMVPKADAPVGKASDPKPPAIKEGPVQTAQVSTAKQTETASDAKAATPDVSKPTVEPQAGEKPAAPATDVAANAAQRGVDTLTLKPGTTAAQALPDATAGFATLPPLAATHTAGTSNIAQPSAQHQPSSSEAVPVAGLAVEIAANAHNGNNRFEIRLDPPELGRIDVQLHIDGEGQVTSHLRVERPETLDLLRRDAQSLERALQQAGLKTSDSGLQFSLRDQSFSQHNQGRDTPATARIVVPDEKLVPVEAQRHYGRLAGTGGGVDIRI